MDEIVVGRKPLGDDGYGLGKGSRAQRQVEVGVIARGRDCGEPDVGTTLRGAPKRKIECLDRLAGLQAQRRDDEIVRRRPEAIRVRQIEEAIEEPRGRDFCGVPRWNFDVFNSRRPRESPIPCRARSRALLAAARRAR